MAARTTRSGRRGNVGTNGVKVEDRGEAPIPPNSSRKRSRAVVKNEEADQDGLKSEPAQPSKRSRHTKTGSASRSKSKAKPKPEPDFEAGAKLADSMAAGGDNADSPSKSRANPYNLTPGASPYPSYPRPTKAECHEVHKRLAAVHGNVTAPQTIPTPNLKSSGCGEVPSVLDALVRTRLSANTNNANSGRAFRGLVERFGVLKEGIGKGSVDWDKVRRTDVSELFEAIKTGGLAGVKSKDIKAILDMVYEENQQRREELKDHKQTKEDHYEHEIAKADERVLSLDHLHSMSSEDAFSKLLEYPGIGPKTASCVLLFCMQRPSFAVDTHVFRLTRWLGWTPSDAELKRMKKLGDGRAPPPVGRNTTYSHLDVRIPDQLKYPLHYLLIRHGKTCPSCTAKPDRKMREEWGAKKCPIKDLKQGSKKASVKEEEESDDLRDDEDAEAEIVED